MRAYSMDLRKRVFADCDAGLRTKQVADKYGVSRSWVRRLKQRRRENNEIGPRPNGRRPRLIDRERLAALVQTQPDATLVELRQRLGLKCSLSAICKALQALKITFKKSPFATFSSIRWACFETTRQNGLGRSSPVRPAATCYVGFAGGARGSEVLLTRRLSAYPAMLTAQRDTLRFQDSAPGCDCPLFSPTRHAACSTSCGRDACSFTAVIMSLREQHLPPIWQAYH